MIFRILIVAFNVVVVAFLIFKIVDVIRRPIERKRKIMTLAGAILLLLAPLGIFFRFFSATPQYFIVYPIAIIMYLYLTRQISIR